MEFKLKIWRQKGPSAPGHFQTISVNEITEDMSFLEMLDIVNQDLIKKGKEPFAFDHDCREGICGTCSLLINGEPHGGPLAIASCQLYMRDFKETKWITVEPFRAKAFPVIKDLMVDRSAMDRIQGAGGYVSVNTGSAPPANSLPVPKKQADAAFSSALCIGCGACVSACPNASASLFVSARIAQLGELPQGRVEEEARVLSMMDQMEKEGFGSCSHTGLCAKACPKEISLEVIANANRLWRKAVLKKRHWK